MPCSLSSPLEEEEEEEEEEANTRFPAPEAKETTTLLSVFGAGGGGGPHSLGAANDAAPTPKKKLAFLFLVRSRIPTAPVWEAFFADAERGLYSIYLSEAIGGGTPLRLVRGGDFVR